MGHGLKGGEGALSCQDQLVFARAVGLVWGARGCIPSRRFNNSWEQLRSHAAEGGIYLQRQSGFRTIYHMRGARRMRLSNAHCAPQHQRSNLSGWGRASAMHNKSALHMGCKYTQLVCLPWAKTASKGVTADRSSTRAQHATQGRMRRTGCA